MNTDISPSSIRIAFSAISAILVASAAISCLLFPATTHAADTLVYSFESGLEGFAPNGGGTAVTLDTVGATQGANSMKVAVVGGQTFSGALTPMLHPAIGDPPGLDHVTFDMTVAEEFEGVFAVIGVMIFGVNQEGQSRQLQTGPSLDTTLEFHIDGLVPGTYNDVFIDMTKFFHPETFDPATFNDIIGTQGSGPLDMIPTSFQLYISKSNDAPVTVFIDNIRVGMTMAAVDGDYNGNTVVDAADFTVWRDNLGLMGGATPAEGDGTGDGNVTQEDYDYWKERFGQPLGGGSVSGVPEPNSALLLFVAIAMGWGRIRKRRREIPGIDD